MPKKARNSGFDQDGYGDEWGGWVPVDQSLNKPKVPQPTAEKGLLSAVASLHSSSKYSDLTIKCGSKSFPVHQCIVCTQSGYFENLCEEESSMSQHAEIEIVLEEPLPLVTKMIDYFYTADYGIEDLQTMSQSGIEWSSKDQDDSSQTFPDLTTAIGRFSFHVEMYTLADRWDIPGLKKRAKRYVEKGLNDILDPTSFSQAICEIYAIDPVGDGILRNVAVNFTMSNLTVLRSTSWSSNKMPLNDNILKDIPEFAHDLLLALMDRAVYSNEYSRRGINGSYAVLHQ